MQCSTQYRNSGTCDDDASIHSLVRHMILATSGALYIVSLAVPCTNNVGFGDGTGCEILAMTIVGCVILEPLALLSASVNAILIATYVLVWWIRSSVYIAWHRRLCVAMVGSWVFPAAVELRYGGYLWLSAIALGWVACLPGCPSISRSSR